MGAKFRLEDLPPHIIARIRLEDRAALGLAAPAVAFSEPRTSDGKGQDGKRAVSRRGPNKTEARYRTEVLDRNPAVTVIGYEALTFHLANGHRYTPDWLFRCGEVMTCVEVKGSYKFGSHQRAKLAFDQARVEFPLFRWIWATWTKNGWETTNA